MTGAAAQQPETQRTSSRVFFAGQWCHFAGASMMGVLFPWILAQKLNLGADLVGLGQMLVQVPMLLILFGGATADGQHLPSYLARLQLMLTVPALALAAATASGALTFEIAVLCGVVTSIIGAFVLPARDSLIADVTPPGTAITLMVAAATSAMFAGQMTGFAIAAAASYTGLLPLLFIQIVLLAGSAILTSRVAPHAGPSRADTRAKPRRSIGQLLKDIREGLTIVAAHERLRTLTLLVSLASLANNAAFIVGLPLLVRDVYRGGSLEQAILFVA
ncbi:MAG TPA: hypothetical protein DCL48_17190, partial [Alphaproteobacteria bacterium]|nr:hypothetical protein [Alphaproteobacteria bacterium]